MGNYVYVMAKRVGDHIFAPVKVGIAKNTSTRLSEIRTSCPFRVELAVDLSMPTRNVARALESAFHRHQSARRLHGEWFDIPPEEAVRILCFGFRLMLESGIPGNPQIPEILERSGVNAAERIVGRYEVDDGVTLQ